MMEIKKPWQMISDTYDRLLYPHRLPACPTLTSRLESLECGELKHFPLACVRTARPKPLARMSESGMCPLRSWGLTRALTSRLHIYCPKLSAIVRQMKFIII